MKTINLLMSALTVGSTGPAWLAQLSSSAVDPDDVVVTALALGLAPMLHYQLEQWGAGLPVPRAQAKLNFVRQAEHGRQAARRAQLAALLPALPAVPIVLKGAYLSECVYPAAGLRPMNDIDLLFRPADLPGVAEVLRRQGYGAKEKSAETGPGITKHTSTFKLAGTTPTPNPYLSSAGHWMIEPHRSLEESWFGLRCDLTPGTWARSRSVDIAGQSARALEPADCLLHLCVHLTYHLIMGSPSFVQLVDIAVYTRCVAVDWDAFIERARSLNAAGYAYAAARLAVRALAAPIPDEVLTRLAAASPSRVRAVAGTLDLRHVVQRTQVGPLRTVAQRLKRGVADRREAARWAHSGSEWRRVWWTLFDFSKTDTWRLLRQKA